MGGDGEGEGDDRSNLELMLDREADRAIGLGMLAIPMVMQEARDAIGEMRRALEAVVDNRSNPIGRWHAIEGAEKVLARLKGGA
jgi:hypothetical protein